MLKKLADTNNDITGSLGESLRSRRKELKLSMQRVADGSGLSVGFISQVERGITAPSLGSLVSISRVLNIPLSDLLNQPDDDGEMKRQDSRPTFRVPGAQMSYERLSTTFDHSKLHSVIVHEPPGSRAEPISHEGEEMFYMLSGSITVEIENEVKILREGDSLHFDSRRTHSTWNHTHLPASILWCGTMDIFRDGPAPIHRSPLKQAADPIPTHEETTE